MPYSLPLNLRTTATVDQGMPLHHRVFTALLLVMLGAFAPALWASDNRNAEDLATAPIFAEHLPFSATVTIRNPHDRAVHVERVDASCTCLEQHLADRFILPHGTTTLGVKVDNANRSGPQRMGVTIYVTDPELEAIEVQLFWHVTPNIAVDALGPQLDPAARPLDIAWRDVYRYTEHERPDELNRLSKRIRLESTTAPEGGLQILGVDYGGPVWAFTPQRQADGSWLLLAAAKDPNGTLPVATYDERVTVRTNHPHKASFVLEFVTVIDSKAGQVAIDPMMPRP